MTQPPGDSYFRPPPTQQPYGQPHGAPAHYPAPPPGWQPPASSVTPGRPPYPPPPTPGGLPLAQPGWRLLARVIDGLIVALLSSPVLGPLYFHLFRHVFDKLDVSIKASQRGQPATVPNIYDGYFFKFYALILLTNVLATMIYEVPQLALWGQTLGKRLCHIRVIDRDGRTRLGFGPALLRWLAATLAPLVPFVGGIYNVLDCLWLLWDKPWRQCLHDKAATTIVVKVS